MNEAIFHTPEVKTTGTSWYSPDVSLGPLTHECEFPILGKSVRFRSNRRAGIESVSSILRHWNRLPDGLRNSERSHTVDLVILEHGVTPAPERYVFEYAKENGVRIARSGANLHIIDADAGRALAYITQDLFMDETAFAWFVVESLALSLVTASARVPFHASAVVREGRAFAFIGRSGAGKSTLAYTCLKHGFDLLAEDVIYVGTEPDYRIWGNSTRLKLLPDSVELFPELASLERRLHPNGEMKIVVPLDRIERCACALQVESISACLVEPNHRSRSSSLERVTPGDVSKYILGSDEPMYGLHVRELPVALDHLLARDAYRLKVGRDVDSVADLLRETGTG